MSINLTEVQTLAASWDGQAMLLLAGPGSGKTRVLTSRIIRLLHEGPNEKWRLAALTFTTRAGDEMRQRVLEEMPEAESRLFVGTFHSFACELLRQSGTHVGVRTDFTIYNDDQDRLLLLKRAIRESDIDYDGPLDKLLPVIDRMRESLAAPDDCHRFFNDPEKAKLFASMYDAYTRFLQTENALDFPALIFQAHCLFKRYPAIAERYRRTFRYLSVDEFQDTNQAQYDFLRQFTGDTFDNVFVVADDDQIIYQWNGASHKRLDDFRRDYRPQELQMPTNFRCPAGVVALANKLVGHNAFRTAGKQPLIAGKLLDELPNRVRTIGPLTTEDDEVAWVAAEIASLGRGNGSTVVIARTKALLVKAQDACRANGVSARLAQRRDEFVSKPFQGLQLVLEVANRPADQGLFDKFVSVANSLLDLNLEAATLVAAADLKNGDLLRTWVMGAESVASGEGMVLIDAVMAGLVERRDYRRFVRDCMAWFKSRQADWLARFPGIEEDFRAWLELQREIALALGSEAGLDAFLQELRLRSKEPKLEPDELPLLTIHGSKGNEFDHVYLIGMAESVLPSFQSLQQGDSSPQMEEERRNCFVAITRCKETLTMTYAQRYRGYPKLPSRFLREMGVVQP